MFIHKKRHRSGAYSIEVLRKDRYSRKNVTVKIIGTSSNAQELPALERKAREFIGSQLGQPIPMDYHYPFEDDLESFLSGISNTQIQVIGPELIYGHLCDKIGRSVILQMDSKQKELYDIVLKNGFKTTHIGRDRTICS